MTPVARRETFPITLAFSVKLKTILVMVIARLAILNSPNKQDRDYEYWNS